MNAPVAFLIDNAAMLLAGSTVLLAIGAIAVAACRAPLHRRRLAELTVLGVVVWLIAAIAPLPRWHRSPDAAPELPIATRAIEAAPPAFELAAALRREPRPPTLAAEPATTPVIPARPSIGPQPMPALTRGPNLRAALGQVAWGPPLTESSRDATIRETTDPLAAGAAPSWPRVLAWSYFAGSGLALGWLLLGFRSLHRMLRRSQPAAPWLTALLGELHPSPGRRPRLRIAADGTQPFCCGLRTPTIVLPRPLATPAQCSRLRQVLLHELAHLQQRDLRGRTLFAVTLPLLFFHPLYWWLRGTARLSAELVADECAAGHSDRTTYARELLSICEEFGRRRALAGTAPVFATRSEFYRRMKMLLQRERSLVTTCSPLHRMTQTCAMVLLIAGAASVFGVEARAQDAAPSTRAAKDEGIEELRAERDRLRSELRAMRKAFASAQRTTAADSVAELPEPPETESVIGRLQRHELALPPGFAPPHGVLDPLSRPAEPPTATESALAPLATLDVFAQPAAAPQPPVPPTPSGDAYVLDLVMRSIELHGEFELQQAAFEDAARNRDAAAGTESEVRTAEIKLRTAERKRRVVDRAIDGELARVADQLDNEDLSPSDRRRLQRQLELLESGRAAPRTGERPKGGR